MQAKESEREVPGVGLRPRFKLRPPSLLHQRVAVRGREMAQAVVASSGGRGGPGPPPPLLRPPTTVPPWSAPRAGFPSPPQATCPGPFVWAAVRLCACAWSRLLGGAPGASPCLGPVPGDPVTVTGSGQSPFYKPVQPQTSAARLGRAEA